MGFFDFIRNYGKEKVKQTGSSIIQTLATWDPEGASEAEISEMEERLDKIVKQVAEARQVYQKEQEEADAINRLYEQRMKAAEILQAKFNDAPESEKGAFEASLNKLVVDLEEMQPEIDRENEEAVEAKEFMEELESVAKASAEKLKNARKALESAKRDMERAKNREDRAKDQADRARVIAGLTSEADKLGSALSAMQKSAQESTARADAHKTKAKLLAPTKEETGDDLIKKAMDEAKGGSAKTGSISDRLAALKKK